MSILRLYPAPIQPAERADDIGDAPPLAESELGFIRLGRDSDCDIVIDNPHLSKHQASFTAYVDGYLIVNLGKNRLHVNGQTCDDAKLQNGDHLRVADFACRVQIETAEQAVAGCLELRVVASPDESSDEDALRVNDVIQLVDGPITIGRSSSADIHLHDPRVSRQHAMLSDTTDGWEIRLISERGELFVDGLSNQSARLETGTQLRIGQYQFVVEDDTTDLATDSTRMFDDSLPRATLVTQYGITETIVIDRSPFLIGRAKAADLRINSQYISRSHAEIVFDGQHWRLNALTARSACMINDHPIPRAALLNDDDTIDLAGFKIIFQADQLAEPKAQPKPVSASPTLTITAPDGSTTEHRLGPVSEHGLSIGSGEQATVQLEDSRLEEIHLLIDRRHGSFFAHSANPDLPFRIDKQQLSKARLFDGDQIRIGRSMIDFHSSNPEDRNPKTG